MNNKKEVKLEQVSQQGRTRLPCTGVKHNENVVLYTKLIAWWPGGFGRYKNLNFMFSKIVKKILPNS